MLPRFALALALVTAACGRASPPPPTPTPARAAVRPAPPRRFVSIARTAEALCALEGSGAVRCVSLPFELDPPSPQRPAPPSVFAADPSTRELFVAGGFYTRHADGSLRLLQFSDEEGGPHVPFDRAPWLVGSRRVWTDGTTTCALGEDGEVRCQSRHFQPWGAPTATLTLERSGPVVELAVGDTTCLRQSDGAVRCFPVRRRASGGVMPTTVVPGLDAVTSIAASAEGGACAIVAGGAVRCWARPPEGGLTDVATVAFPASARSVTVSRDRVCALLDDDSVRCVGQWPLYALDLDAPPPRCVPAAPPAWERLCSVSLTRDGAAIRYCLREQLGLPRSCWRVALDAGEVTPIPVPTERAAPGAAIPAPPPAPSACRVARDGVNVTACCGDACRSFPLAPRPEETLAATASGRWVVRTAPPRGGDRTVSDGWVETFDTASGRRVARFRMPDVSPTGIAARPTVLGDSLLSTRCSVQGPQCDGALASVSTGRLLARLDVNFYGGECFPVRGREYACADAGRVVWYDVDTGRELRRLALPAHGWADTSTLVARGAHELLVVHAGNRDAAETSSVVRVDLLAGAVVARLGPPRCDTSAAPR